MCFQLLAVADISCNAIGADKPVRFVSRIIIVIHASGFEFHGDILFPNARTFGDPFFNQQFKFDTRSGTFAGSPLVEKPLGFFYVILTNDRAIMLSDQFLGVESQEPCSGLIDEGKICFRVQLINEVWRILDHVLVFDSAA